MANIEINNEQVRAVSIEPEGFFYLPEVQKIVFIAPSDGRVHVLKRFLREDILN